MTPIVGERLGPYEILGRLGRGGMGQVYRAWDGRLHREVAIKLLGSDAFAPGGKYPVPGSRERFLQEARAASALNHPHICTVFDIGEKDGAPYLVMELMEGETLMERIERGPLPVDEMVTCAVAVANALGAAHAQGIVHRDIKPANIFLVERPNGDRQTKVLDFGLAKVERRMADRLGMGFEVKFDRRAKPAEDAAGTTAGTVAYMSPEQARGESLDGRSDLFSLGVVMYEMATQRSPFQRGTNVLTFERLLNDTPEPIRDWNDLVPKSLEKIILQLLEKNAERRFQSAAEVSAALHGLSAKGGTNWRAVPAIPLMRTSDPVARGRRPFGGLGDVKGLVRPLSHSGEMDGVDVVVPERDGSAAAEAFAGDADKASAKYGRRWQDRAHLGSFGSAEEMSPEAQAAECSTCAARKETLKQETKSGPDSVDELEVVEVGTASGGSSNWLRVRASAVWIVCGLAGVGAAVAMLVWGGLR
jgi:eukaryotic-like serine/threonine-protein kinase